MDNAQTAVAAAVGAAVAVTVLVVADQIGRHKDRVNALFADVVKDRDNAWWQGRESVISQMTGQVRPENIPAQ